tara:strand:+ start:5382 stop:5927 length:546 start_codon:yes stop_codon:yes gene_type:complete
MIDTIKVPSLQEVSSTSRELLENVQQKLGMVPNLYATIGYSSSALKAMLDTEATLTKDASFSAKEREAINLIVSQVNQCDYCLAAHTALAKMRGFSEADTLAIRIANYSDAKLNLVLQLAASIAENKGSGDTDLKEDFFDAGYDHKALVELIALIALRSFTNFVFSNIKVPVDFPAAAPLN